MSWHVALYPTATELDKGTYHTHWDIYMCGRVKTEDGGEDKNITTNMSRIEIKV